MAEVSANLDTLRDSAEVELWTVDLGAEAARQDDYWQILSKDERERAERFHFVRDRDRYIRARGKLRCLVAEYLAQAPADVVFGYGPQGKPEVQGDLQFNLAHSEDFALYAFTAGRRVGVDIERLRAMDDAEALATRFFSAEECRDLMSVPQAQRNAVFFACWTRKESFVKAVGAGLTLPLKSFRVAVLPDAEVKFLANQHAGKWTLFDVHPAMGYRGAVTVEGQASRLVCREKFA
jgi:4'-phosphopantetheinyl transferase